MALIVQSKDITLDQLQASFNLQQASDPNFFREWQEDLPFLKEEEKLVLERVKHNYANLIFRRSLSEEAVKMVVLSPLLDLAGFYQPPFFIETETPSEILAEDEEVVIKGKIDVLIIYRRLWVLVIESKNTKFDVMTALPQCLSYLLNSPNSHQPTYGFLSNGREFVFIKFMPGEVPQYRSSYALSLDREDDLYRVLRILKSIGQAILNLVN